MYTYIHYIYICIYSKTPDERPTGLPANFGRSSELVTGEDRNIVKMVGSCQKNLVAGASWSLVRRPLVRVFTVYIKGRSHHFARYANRQVNN